MAFPVLAALGAGAAIAGGVGNLITNFENLNLQRENLDYQKAVQKKIWEREDTAIQRRKQDLQAAGFNPYLAMNSNGAGAGQVVSTQAPQNHADFSFIGNSLGSAVDFMRSLEQLKQDKLFTSYQKMQNLDFGNSLYSEYGFISPSDGKWHIPDMWKDGLDAYNTEAYHEKSLAWRRRLANIAQNQYSINEANELDKRLSYETDMLKVQRDFAVSDKIESYIMDAIDSFIGASAEKRGWYRDTSKQYPKQDYERRSYRDRNGVYHEYKSYR